MATERELKTTQEDRLFDILIISKLVNEGKESELTSFLRLMREKAQSGMTAEEIDAVRQRVSRAITNE